MSDFTNRTYDEIAVGQSETTTRTLTATDIEALALAAGDVDGYHLDEKDPDDRPSAQAAASNSQRGIVRRAAWIPSSTLTCGTIQKRRPCSQAASIRVRPLPHSLTLASCGARWLPQLAPSA